MVKKSMRVIIVMLCAVMVVCGCFAGCKEKPQYKEVTKQEVYEAFKAEYPDAEIVGEDHKLYLNANYEYPCIGNYWLDLDSNAIPEGFTLYCKHYDEAKNITNIFMKVFYDSKESDLEDLLNYYEIDDEGTVTRRNNCFKYKDKEIEILDIDSVIFIAIY